MSINSYQLSVTSNDPFGSSFMDATAGATYLVTELQTLKADMRGQSLNKTWISLIGLQGVWTGNLVWTVISGTQASIQGDQTVATGTGYVIVGNRVKAFVTAGTIYGTITAATAGGGNTTVTFAWDSGALDSGLSDIQQALDLSKVLAGALNYALITNGGSGSAFTGNLSSAIAAYVQGAEYTLKWTQASQGSDTVALNGLSALSVKKLLGGAYVALSAGDIPAGGIINVAYDSTAAALLVTSGLGGAAVSSAIFTTPGSASWTVPSGVTAVIVELYGAGGGGASTTNIGGDGAYMKLLVTGLTPGGTVPYVVGAGGTPGNPGTAGGVSTFNGISVNGGGAGSNSTPGTNAAAQQAPGNGVVEQQTSFSGGGSLDKQYARGGAINSNGENGAIVIRW